VQRAHQWLHALAADGPVDVLVVQSCPVGAPSEPCAPAADWLELTPVPSRSAYLRRAAAAAGARLCGARPLSFVGWQREWAFVTPAALAELRRHFRERTWDRVVAFRLRTFDYAHAVVRHGWARAEDVVLDLDDIESNARRSIAGSLARLRRWREAALTWCDAQHAARVEREAARVFPRLAVCCEEDQRELEQRLADVCALVMPNRRYTLPETLPRGPAAAALFIGALGYPPNEEAVRFLVREVMPAASARFVGRMTIAGFGARSELRQVLTGRDGVHFAGAVRDVRESYAAAGVVFAPLFSGGGTKLKVIEALAFGRPLVATRHAVRGLGLTAGREFLLAETAADCAAAWERLVSDAELRAGLAERGRAAVEQRFVYG
jgi:hypothetical protein